MSSVSMVNWIEYAQAAILLGRKDIYFVLSFVASVAC